MRALADKGLDPQLLRYLSEVEPDADASASELGPTPIPPPRCAYAPLSRAVCRRASVVVVFRNNKLLYPRTAAPLSVLTVT